MSCSGGQKYAYSAVGPEPAGQQGRDGRASEAAGGAAQRQGGEPAELLRSAGRGQDSHPRQHPHSFQVLTSFPVCDVLYICKPSRSWEYTLSLTLLHLCKMMRSAHCMVCLPIWACLWTVHGIHSAAMPCAGCQLYLGPHTSENMTDVQLHFLALLLLRG